MMALLQNIPDSASATPVSCLAFKEADNAKVIFRIIF